MTMRLMLSGIARGKVRFVCAAAGVAAAVGAVVFMFSLAAAARKTRVRAMEGMANRWYARRDGGITIATTGGTRFVASATDVGTERRS